MKQTKNNATKARNLQLNGDICRNNSVEYTIKEGGRKFDKPKLNFRFHNPNTPEELTKILLCVCIDANMKKVEQIVREEAAATFDENSTGDKNEPCHLLPCIN